MLDKKIPLFLMVFLFICNTAVSAAITGEGRKNDSKEVTIVGTIQTSEAQGNNYLELAVKVANNEVDHIWCSGEKTQVYISAKPAYWDELKSGRRITVVGNWITQEGRKLLWARRIDLP